MTRRRSLLISVDFGFHACSSLKSMVCIQNNVFHVECFESYLGRDGVFSSPIAPQQPPPAPSNQERPVHLVDIWFQHLPLMPLWNTGNLQGSEKSFWCTIFLGFLKHYSFPNERRHLDIIHCAMFYALALSDLS